MEIIEVLFYIGIGTILAYMIGSIPTSILASKFYFGIDIRDHGSGTATHVNVYRVLGWKASLPVRLIDIAKGVFAAKLSLFLTAKYGWYDGMEMSPLMMSFGLAAVLGHIFPMFAQFRGGKGVHVAIGVLLVLNPLASGICALIGVLVFLITRYPNLGYVLASMALPIFMLLDKPQDPERALLMLIFSLILFVIMVLTHLNNLKDIVRGEEVKAWG